ncbi:MAG: methyltransferase [Candidatus Aenigmarchaeota archaeon]|nr:methyltransferase [Candidatus Aenigmarchaeota archaeon]
MVKAYFKGLVLEVLDGVYVPREDTELLAETLDVKNVNVLDVGTGSGALALFAAKTARHVTGVDIDPQAVVCATKNAELNGVTNVTFVESDLFERVRGRFDVIAFNPPYLPVTDAWESRTWNGGANGRETIERFAKGLGEHLAPKGHALVLVSSLTGLEETKKLFVDRGFHVAVAREKKIMWETLYVLRIVHKD